MPEQLGPSLDIIQSPSNLRVEVSQLSALKTDKRRPQDVFLEQYATPATAEQLITLASGLTEVFGEGNVGFALYGSRNIDLSQLVRLTAGTDVRYWTFTVPEVKSDARTLHDVVFDAKRAVNHLGWAASNVPSLDAWKLKTSEGLYLLKEHIRQYFKKPILAIEAHAGYWIDTPQVGELIDNKADYYRALGLEVIKFVKIFPYTQTNPEYFDFIREKMEQDRKNKRAPTYIQIDLGKHALSQDIHGTDKNSLQILRDSVDDPEFSYYIYSVALNQFNRGVEAHERLDLGTIDHVEGTRIMGRAAKANKVSEHFHAGIAINPIDYQWFIDPNGGLLYCKALVRGWEEGYGNPEGA